MKKRKGKVSTELDSFYYEAYNYCLAKLINFTYLFSSDLCIVGRGKVIPYTSIASSVFSLMRCLVLPIYQ